ncbi:MAG: DUF2917 domain-containing protein [Anaerolineales bacterium]|nr:DUF2917 domain-containing protein [Anaerolineales bacterium]
MIAIEHCKHIDLNLHQHEVLKLSPNTGLEIECEKGILWVTSAGDNNDHTLSIGESYVARGPSTLVIEAIEDAVVNLKDMDEEPVIPVIA